MSEASRVRVYLGCSFDGFIAGADDDLSFLHDVGPVDDPASAALGFEDFLAQIGVMIMGRRTYDVVAGMGVWPYGDLAVWVPTHRPLEPVSQTVRAVSGDISELIAAAKEAAGDRDVYLDGGQLVRDALNAGQVDEFCLTFLPILLGGQGKRLFEGLVGSTKLEFVAQHRLGPMLQVTATVVRGG